MPGRKLGIIHAQIMPNTSSPPELEVMSFGLKAVDVRRKFPVICICTQYFGKDHSRLKLGNEPGKG